MARALQLLRDQRDRLRREIESAQAELRRVNAAIEALSAQDLFDELSNSRQARRVSGSLKQMAYTVLREAGEPMTASEILSSIERQFGLRIERTSMSPQLSRLGQEHFLTRNANEWAIDQRRTTLGDAQYLLRSSAD